MGSCSSCCKGRRFDLQLSQALLARDVPEDSTVLVLTLKRGTRLLAADVLGLSDPYVLFRLGAQKQASTKKSRTLNPVWEPEETFRFHVTDLEEPVVVSVFDADLVGDDDSIGDALVHLARYAGLGRTETVLRLINPLNGKPECGTLTLEVFVTDKLRAFAQREDDIYEYERFDSLMRGWRAKFGRTDPRGGHCHWSTCETDREPAYSNEMDRLVPPVPPDYEVASSWGYMMTQGDPDGWVYATSFGSVIWLDTQHAHTFVRRRRWRRVLRKRGC